MSGPRPKVSVVIPSFDGYREGNLPKLKDDLKQQSFKDIEIVVVEGIRPNGKARNEGAKKAKGEFLVFIDDDVTLGHTRVIENLIRVLEGDKSIAMVGPSQQLHPDSTAFQKRYAREMPRATSPIVGAITESDVVTHMCMAISRDLYFKIGMENENLLRGTDPDLRQRVRKAGFKVVLAPDTWAYHPAPANLRQLISVFFDKGVGSAWVFKNYPELVYEAPVHEESNSVGRVSIQHRFFRQFKTILKSLLTLRLIFLVAQLSYIWGYIIGLIKANKQGIERL